LFDQRVTNVDFDTKRRVALLKEHQRQARNQLGTPGGAKSFPRGAQIFLNMLNSFTLCPTHFSRVENFSRGDSPPLVTVLTSACTIQETNFPHQKPCLAQ